MTLPIRLARRLRTYWFTQRLVRAQMPHNTAPFPRHSTITAVQPSALKLAPMELLVLPVELLVLPLELPIILNSTEPCTIISTESSKFAPHRKTRQARFLVT